MDMYNAIAGKAQMNIKPTYWNVFHPSGKQ